MSAVVPKNPQGNQAAAYLTWVDASGAANTLIFDCVESEDWEDGATVTEHPVEDGPNVADNVRVQLSRCALKVFATNHPIVANNWSDISSASEPFSLPQRKPPPTNDGIDLVPDWQSNLTARILLGTAGGVVGSAFGGAASAVGSLAASAIAGALLNGKIVYDLTHSKTGAPQSSDPTVAFPVVATMDTPDDYVERMVQQLLGLKNASQLIDVKGTKQEVSSMVISVVAVHRDAETGAGAEIALELTEVRIVSTSTVAAPSSAFPRAAPGTVSKGNQNTTDADDAQDSAFSQGYADGQSDVAAVVATP